MIRIALLMLVTLIFTTPCYSQLETESDFALLVALDISTDPKVISQRFMNEMDRPTAIALIEKSGKAKCLKNIVAGIYNYGYPEESLQDTFAMETKIHVLENMINNQTIPKDICLPAAEILQDMFRPTFSNRKIVLFPDPRPMEVSNEVLVEIESGGSYQMELTIQCDANENTFINAVQTRVTNRLMELTETQENYDTYLEQYRTNLSITTNQQIVCNRSTIQKQAEAEDDVAVTISPKSDAESFVNSVLK